LFGNRGLPQTCARYAGSSGDLLPPSPPAEKASGLQPVQSPVLMIDLIFNTIGLDIIFIVVVLRLVGSTWGIRRQAPSGSTWHHRPYQPDQRHQDDGRTKSYKQQSNFSHGPPSRHQFFSKS
jgi:hypothetical protein